MKTEIKIYKNKAVLCFNGKIYSQRLIEGAVSSFNEVCNISYLDGKAHIESKDKDNVLFLAYEFFNYLLALIQNESL